MLELFLSCSMRTFKILQQLERALREQPDQRLSDFWATVSDTPPESAALVSDDLLRQELYSQLARPWERLKRQKRKKAVLGKRLATEWCTFEVLNLETALMRKPLTIGFLLEFLRNAISHDKLRIDAEQRVTFSDWEHNRLRFSFSGLQRLMEAFQAFRDGD